MLKNAQKNGLQKGNDPKNVAVVPKPNPAPAKAAEPTKSTLEAIIQKADELRGLTTKRQRTIDTYNQIRTFTFSSDENCVLTIVDSQGAKFQTNNSNLINLLKEYFAKILGDKVSALDDEILNFTL